VIPDEDVMIGTMTRSVRATVLFAVATLAACSTQSVAIQATRAPDMNPSRAGGSGTLKVHLFFLKDSEAFMATGKSRGEYLDSKARRDGKAPLFCEADVVDVQEMLIPPASAADAKPVAKTFVVSNEATCVGVVADFQQHAENDDQVVWRLAVPIKGGVCAFHVAGRKLELPKPKKRETKPNGNTDG